MKNGKKCRLIGDIIGHNQASIGDWWYAKRIQHFIEAGIIKVLEDAERPYARLILLPGDRFYEIQLYFFNGKAYNRVSNKSGAGGIKMIKIGDIPFGTIYRKTYRDDKDIDVLAFINGLYETNFEPIRVRLIEGVERDMQSVDGDEYLVSTFLEKYDDIKTMGHDLMYRLYGDLGNDHVIITLADDYPVITISTENPDIELEDILEKVSE